MTPEAQQILFDYFAQEELELYNKYIDSATSSIQSRSATRSNSPENAARAAAVNEMTVLGNNLRQTR